jgi:1-deoxy-D-xylulose-5-phosphate synthase
VILNDNAIGIDPSVGAKNYQLKTEKSEQNMIRSLNIDYSGPIDGHDIFAVIKELKRLQNKGPKFLHIITTKGIKTSRRRPSKIPCRKFDASTGEIHKKLEENLPPKYQDVLG